MSIPTPPNGMVSNTELILRKILGEDVTPLPPNSRVEFYLVQVEEYIERLATGATRPIGETTTALTDGATTNPIKIDGEDYTAQINDLVFYGNKEFLFTVNGWREVGDLTNLNADMIDDTNTTKKFTNATEKETWNGKQDTIDSTHKLSADLVDDTTTTHKFATAAELSQIETNKTNISSLQATIQEEVKTDYTLKQSDFSIDGYIKPDGTFVEFDGIDTTDYIPVKVGTLINGTAACNGNYSVYALYDINKNFVSNYVTTQEGYFNYSLTIPDEIAYIRFCASYRYPLTTARIQWELSTELNEINETINGITKTKNYYVGYGRNDGVTYFNNVVDCLYEAQDYDGYKVINIKNGTYDVLSELGGMEYVLSKNVNDDTWRDVQPVLHDAAIIGHGNVILNFNITNGTSYDNYWLFSCLNICGNVKIENIEINASNCRYCIHDENGSDYQNTKHEYINVRAHKSGEGGQTIGCGYSANTRVYINSCVFDNQRNDQSVYTCHSADGGQFVFENTVFEGHLSVPATIRISEDTLTAKLKTHISNCFITNSIRIRHEGSNPNAVDNTRITLVNTAVDEIINDYTTINEPVISYNTIAGTKTVLITPD